LKQFKNMITTEEDIRFNNTIILAALKDIGLKISVDINVLTNGTDREMMMFVLELF